MSGDVLPVLREAFLKFPFRNWEAPWDSIDWPVWSALFGIFAPPLGRVPLEGSACLAPVMCHTVTPAYVLNARRNTGGIKDSVSQIRTGKEIVTKGKHFLKHQCHYRDCSLFTIYIPSYGPQDFALISFFEVLTDLQAKVSLTLWLPLTRSHELILGYPQQSSSSLVFSVPP